MCIDFILILWTRISIRISNRLLWLKETGRKQKALKLKMKVTEIFYIFMTTLR